MFQASGTRFGSRGNSSGLHPKHTQIACSVGYKAVHRKVNWFERSCHVTNFPRGSELKSIIWRASEVPPINTATSGQPTSNTLGPRHSKNEFLSHVLLVHRRWDAILVASFHREPGSVRWIHWRMVPEKSDMVTYPAWETYKKRMRTWPFISFIVELAHENSIMVIFSI